MSIINSFPGYECVYDEKTKTYRNMYRGTDVGRGGYIRSIPGMYGNVALLDIRSMHPTSAVQLNAFGEYTKNFEDILNARVAIKQGDYDSARKMFGGRLSKYLDDESTAKDLAQALKIAINSVYGLTSASFTNPFRDSRNKNNIVALRGALFMRTLQDEVEHKGFIVASIRTDSIKIPDATPEIIKFCMDFAEKYGYVFEHEATYDRMCLVNDSAYIAKYATSEHCEELYGYIPGDNKKHGGEWTATAAQFQVPYVFKKLFTREPIEFKDLCETKEVKKGAIYLDMDENLPDVTKYEREFEKAEDGYKKGLLSDTTFEDTCAKLLESINEGHDYHFIGRIGQFCPIKPGHNGGVLYCKRDDKYDSVNGTKGYRWLESETVELLGKQDAIDMSYYNTLVDAAIYGSGSGAQRKPGISDFGDFEWFISDDPYIPKQPVPGFMNIPEDIEEEELPFD